MAAEREREREQLKCWKIRHEPPLVVSWSAKEEEVAALETSRRSNSTAGEGGGGGGGRRAPTQILLFECSASGISVRREPIALLASQVDYLPVS